MNKLLSMSVICLGLAACEHEYSVRCNHIDEKDISQIQVGKSNKDDVSKKLGTPFIVTEKNVWLYMCRHEDRTPFRDPMIKESANYRISFDEKGIVRNIEKVDLPYKKMSFDKGYTPVNAVGATKPVASNRTR